MAKVAYRHVDPDGTFSFHRRDGSLVEVGEKGYQTDEPGEIAYLDTVKHVKRASKPASGEEA